MIKSSIVVNFSIFESYSRLSIIPIILKKLIHGNDRMILLYVIVKISGFQIEFP